MNEKKLAVLIDSDNVSAKYAQFIMQEAAKYGTPTYKRVYGDWEKGGNGWHNPAINYSIMPVQQSCYIAGKNATDFSMIIDAMDILYTGSVDGFVLVTSDSDFTRLAIRLREAGKLVVGIGELKTPRAFTISCHHFCYLNQVCEPEGMADEATIRKAVLDFVTENKDQRIDLARVSAVLTSRFGNINFDELGYKRFSSFIDSFKELRRSNTFITLKKPRAEEKPAPRKENVTEGDIAAAIGEYFEKNAPERDNMMKLESYLTNIFGKIDYSQFGSKRFAKFIDRLDGYTRDGTNIAPVSSAKPAEAPVAAESEPKHDIQTFAQTVTDIVNSAMPVGANIGNLNQSLAAMFGKEYFKSLGYKDFRSALASVSGLRIDGNNILAAQENTSGEPEMHTKATAAGAAEIVLAYAAAAMPDGGNIGELNNELMNAFGKDYLADLGFDDYKTMLESIDGIRVRRNHVFMTDGKYADYVESLQKQAAAKDKKPEAAAAEKPDKPDHTAKETPAEPPKKRGRKKRTPDTEAADLPAAKPETEPAAEEITAKNTADEKPAAKSAGKKAKAAANKSAETKPAEESKAPAAAEAKPASETAAPSADKAEPTAEKPEDKPEINAVKREILQIVAGTENGAALSVLGNQLSEKFGRKYLSALGFRTIKKLLGSMKGLSVSGDTVSITEEFATRTAEIEQFVSEYAHGEGSRSVRALSSQLKKRFDGFDFSDYGFAKFTDFVNAIDGVKADRYRVSPEEE